MRVSTVSFRLPWRPQKANSASGRSTFENDEQVTAAAGMFNIRKSGGVRLPHDFDLLCGQSQPKNFVANPDRARLGKAQLGRI